MKAVTVRDELKLEQLEQQLRVKERELNSLLQITQAINNNILSQGLLRIYESLLVNQIGVGKVAVFIHSEHWERTNAFGIQLKDAEEKISKYLPSFLQITRLENSSHPLAKYFDVVIPVFHKDFPLAFTLLGDFRKELHIALDDKLNYIQTISNVIALAIENKRLFRAQASQKMLKSDLELAGQMQTMLIPGKLPDDERISILVLLVALFVQALLEPLGYEGSARPLLWSLVVAGCVLGSFHLRAAAQSPVLVEARLLALTARIRPHFLFNSLNGVLGVLRSNPRRAEEGLEELADLFRALMQDNRELVRLADEIALCERYLNLERLRLGDRLEVVWQRDAEAEAARVPPLFLQPLVENAVYHGIEPGAGPGRGCQLRKVVLL